MQIEGVKQDHEQQLRDQAQSIVELAECVKALVRLIEIGMLSAEMRNRVEKIYHKAKEAKDRMAVQL